MVPHFAFVHWECFALKRSLLICGPWTPAASRLALIQRRTETSTIHLIHSHPISDQTHAPLSNAVLKIHFMSSNAKWNEINYWQNVLWKTYSGNEKSNRFNSKKKKNTSVRKWIMWSIAFFHFHGQLAFKQKCKKNILKTMMSIMSVFCCWWL